MPFQFPVIQILLRPTSTNHTLIFKMWFSLAVLLKGNIQPECMLELGQGWAGELGREKEIVVASCFLISVITPHRMNSATLLFTTFYLPSRDVQMPLVSSCFLSEKSENETSCSVATSFNDHKFVAFT